VLLARYRSDMPDSQTSDGRRGILGRALMIAPWLLAALLAAGWGLSLWTPGYLEGLVPELARGMGLPLREFHIRAAGLFSADIGPVVLQADDDAGPAPPLRLEGVHLAYTPASLRLGRVSRVVVRGARLTAAYDGRTLTLPILALLPATSTDAGEPIPEARPVPTLPFDELVVEDSALTVDVQGHNLTIPFAATVTPGSPLRVAGALRLRDQTVNVSGSLGPTLNNLALTVTTPGFQLASLDDLLPTPVRGSLNLDLTASLDLARPDTLKAEAKATLSGLDLAATGLSLADTPIQADIALADNATTASLSPLALTGPAAVTVQIPEARYADGTLTMAFTLDVPEILPGIDALPGTLTARKQDGSWDVALNIEKQKSLAVAAGQRTVTLGGVSLALHGTVTPASAALTLEAATRSCALTGTPLTTGPVTLRLPLAWPAPGHGAPGRLTVAALRQGTLSLGSVSAELWQQSLGLGVRGRFDAAPLPGLRAPFTGDLSLETGTASLRGRVAHYTLPAGFTPASLGPTIAPGMQGVTVGGTMDAECGLRLDDSGMETRLALFVTNGSMAFGTDGVRLDGIRLYFEAPDLVNFRSDPAQMLAFDRLTAGAIEMTDGVITFQVEPGGVVLVERGRFTWCGGHLESRAFRVVPGRDEYDATLHCTGLKLTELLRQLGLARATGDSALSGELPVTWNHGKLIFNEGFLHSTPGEGGVIQVEGLDDLVSAIPEGSTERTQIELARAALKDFQYSWIRLRADSVGDDLLMRLSVDGKPSGILPFVYRKDFGGFIKVEGDIKGSNFQGLRLDVNFALPLDRLLLYKDLIGRIE
jgi:hypothetical protein